MSCPHCGAPVAVERRRLHGGQCPACRRLFVTGGRVAYTDLSPEFLRERVAALSENGALRVTSLQLQRDAHERRPYPPRSRRPWWYIGRRDFQDLPTAPVVAALVTKVVGVVAAAVWWNWSIDVIVVAAILAATTLVFVAHAYFVLFNVPLIAGRGVARLARLLVPDRRRVVLTPSAFTALARTVAGDVVDEDGMAPPPAPEPARFAVLCPDPAVAACLWANNVGALGALVVAERRHLRRGLPVLDLSRCTSSDPPLALLTAVLRFGRDHADAGATGFLGRQVSG
jgi:hypothetical protein